MFTDSPPTIRNECYTTTAIICTFFACLCIFLLIFALFYLAYFKPFFNDHKYCIKQQQQQQQNEKEQQISAITLLEQYDTQNKFSYPKYICDMQISPKESCKQQNCKQSYIKHREYRRRRKKRQPISLSTINENYVTDSFPKSTIIDDKWIVGKEMYAYDNRLFNNCKCRNCTFSKIMNSNARTIRQSVLPECHSTPV
ncbi:Uncharacterized protein BM_BM17330 [Brugia malayi]|uniref:Uncharacterized protein n=1 Tax=Brugia malayi TaxID=6279 RepID=A0A4E9F2J5_BRUMA|nr:Uncharacterized protein BM_BM17330 [Brugia malayi]VIO90268.1 Uncharacterized protein BM_BM17330 [Brugia malayi]